MPPTQIRGRAPEKMVAKFYFAVKDHKLIMGLEIDHAEVWMPGLQ